MTHPNVLLQKLTNSEFEATFTPPIQIQQINEGITLEVELYLKAVLKAENLALTIDQLELHCVYTHPKNLYKHLIFTYGQSDHFLVMVLNLSTKTIKGYHLLNLSEHELSMHSEEYLT